ncbi:ABZJ_00895 family protein [Ruegeria sp.]|uniref:ABZJ_00895 family protein n=1 Tax=Ruegeria sp. TaxID=1879320 RepID=UPI00231A8451|nr:ABZJ_00895 family protein [Ruegeria sp.]MDA7966000.1 ABZJ_00895 family protein [Ruegeria sp.]
MKTISLWQYTVWLVAIRFLLPISIVMLLVLTGINLTNVGIPVLSAILASAAIGRGVARAAGCMPGWRELLAFAVLATLIFFFVNYAAYVLLAWSGIGPIDFYTLNDWHRTGQIVFLMAFLTTVAFISNAVVFPFCIKAELRAMTRRQRKEQEQ